LILSIGFNERYAYQIVISPQKNRYATSVMTARRIYRQLPGGPFQHGNGSRKATDWNANRWREYMKTTVMDVFRETVSAHADQTALKHKRDGRWHTLTWQDYDARVRTTAKAFMALGLAAGKAVSILANNCPRWFISDLAAIFAGAIPGGIYTTSTPEQCHYIAEHSEANIVVVEDAAQLAKFADLWPRLPDLKAIVMMNGSDADERVIAWQDLPELASRTPDEALDARMQAQAPEDCCTLIYTSGTTGNPKGVMITHDNIVWTARRVVDTCEGRSP
jgi:long-subunit acyl-CoA synthetase (AMP-forming)